MSDHLHDAAFLKPFRLGLLGVAALFLVLGGLTAAFGSTDHPRPEGVAERWLSDIGDTYRDGVKDRARKDAEEIGPVSLGAQLLPPPGSSDGRAAFLDLEVGKARDEAARTLVPFRLHQRIDGSAGDPIEGTIVLQRTDDHWRITALAPKVDGIEVPSEGGAPAAEAPMGLFLGAIVVSFGLAALCSVAVRAAGRAAEATEAPAS